jgi:type I restriction enzyme S subunit
MKLTKLSELLDISIGRTPSRSEPDYWGKGYPWVSIRDLNSKTVVETKEQITDQAVSEVRCKLVPKGTLLFSFKLTIGKMAFAGCDLYTNEAIAAFSIKDKKKLHPDFLYYALQAATYGGSNQAVMGKTLNSKSLADIAIPVPPLENQIRIAHLLGKVEALIFQRKQHLQQLDDLLKSVFLEMFGDPSRNERGWTKGRIGQAIKVQGGFAFKSKDIASSGAVKLVKIANVHFENLTWNDVSYVPDSFLDVYKKFVLHEDDLLIALTRPVIKSLNVVKTAAVRKEDLPCLLNQRVARFLIDQSRIKKRFFLQFCYTEFFRKTVDGLCPPGLQPNISTNQIEEIPIFYPPVALQNDFEAIANKVEGIKFHYQSSLTKLEALYGVLSQRTFNTKLDLQHAPEING